MTAFLWSLSIFVSIVMIAGAVLLFTPLGNRPLTALFPVGDPGAIDFAALKLTDRPNQFLMCPPGFCGKPHAESRLFDVPVERLRAAWRKVVAARPRVTLLTEDADGRLADYIQRSAHFRFPDVITVRFIAVSASRSTLAIYSRSLYGRSDLGVNRARVEAWVIRLRASLESAAGCPTS